VFDCGTRFVWYSGDIHQIGGGNGVADEEEVMEGALVHHVNARFVAVEESEVGRGGEFAEGGGDAGRSAGGGVGVEGLGHTGVLDAPGTADTPEGGGHILDHGALDAIDGHEALEVTGENGLETFERLAGKDDAVGEKAVLHGILRRAFLAFRSDRATGLASVGARSIDAT